VQIETLSGILEPAGLPRTFLSLQTTARTGRLRLEREGVARDFFLRSGLMVWADSTAPTDSLEWLMFTAGILSEERHEQVRSQIAKGIRRGRALIGSGAVTPVLLCEWVDRRVRFLARDAILWKDGTLQFDEGLLPPPGTIEVRLAPVDIILSAARERTPPVFEPLDPNLVLTTVPPAVRCAAVPLLPHESYVESLVDGRRCVSEICALSETGEMETLRALSLLAVAGVLAPAGEHPLKRTASDTTESAAPDPVLPFSVDLPGGETPAEIRAIARLYNDLYASVYAHLIKEVGPIADQVLDKHLRETREHHATVLARAVTGRGGTLSEDTVIRNMNLLKDPGRRERLVVALHDYLRAMVLAVRRILGPEHEAAVVRRLQEQRCART